MAALLPTPSSDRDPGSRQRPGQQQLPNRHSRICFLILPWTTGKGQLKERAVLGCFSCFPPSLPYASLPVVLSLFLCFLFPFLLFSLLSFPCPCSTLPLFLSSFLSSFASFAPEPHLAHLLAPTSCAIPVVCSGLGQGQTWQNRWIPGEAAEPMGSHPIPSSRGCTGE